MKKKDVTVFHYIDYRKFLRDSIQSRCNQANSFSLEALARRVRGLSRPHLSLILNGQRNLTISNALKLSKALGLNKHETDFFNLLVNYNQSKDPEEREHHLACILKKTKNSSCQFEENHYSLLESWVNIAVLELARLKNFEANPKIIRKQLKNEASIIEIKLALKQLFGLQLLEQTDEGRIEPRQPTFSTTFDLQNIYIQKYHLDTIALAKKKLLKDAVKEREFGSITFPVDAKSFKQIKKRLQDFYHEILNEFPAENKNNIAQLNIQFFQLSDEITNQGGEE